MILHHNMSKDSDNSAEEYCQGVVKWFNNKAGYGFVTATSGDKEGTDIFVHHTSIQTEKEQYKYLVQGEYIEFTVVPTDEGVEHDCQAGSIRGINSGKLMCETRFENRRPRRRPQGAQGAQGAQGDQETAEDGGSGGRGARRGGGGPREGMNRGAPRRRGGQQKKQQEQAQEV